MQVQIFISKCANAKIQNGYNSKSDSVIGMFSHFVSMYYSCGPIEIQRGIVDTIRVIGNSDVFGVAGYHFTANVA